MCRLVSGHLIHVPHCLPISRREPQGYNRLRTLLWQWLRVPCYRRALSRLTVSRVFSYSLWWRCNPGQAALSFVPTWGWSSWSYYGSCSQGPDPTSQALSLTGVSLSESHYETGIEHGKAWACKGYSRSDLHSPSRQGGLLAHGSSKHLCQVKCMTMTSLYLDFTKATTHSLPSFIFGRTGSPSSIVCSFFSLGWADPPWPPQTLPSPWGETGSLVASFPVVEDWCLFTTYEENVNDDKSYFYNVFIHSVADINNT